MSGVAERTPVAWCAARRPHPAESVCGDAFSAIDGEAGLLLAVADGLGHGPLAADAAEAAMVQVRSAPHLDLVEHFRRADAALRRLRGAALTLVRVSPASGRLTWTGVGNVEAVLVDGDGRRRYAPLRGGIVGHQMPSLRVVEESIASNSWLILWTDGVHPSVAQLTPGREQPSEWLARVPAYYFQGGDDALVLAARLGGP